MEKKIAYITFPFDSMCLSSHLVLRPGFGLFSYISRKNNYYMDYIFPLTMINFHFFLFLIFYCYDWPPIPKNLVKNIINVFFFLWKIPKKLIIYPSKKYLQNKIDMKRRRRRKKQAIFLLSKKYPKKNLTVFMLFPFNNSLLYCWTLYMFVFFFFIRPNNNITIGSIHIFSTSLLYPFPFCIFYPFFSFLYCMV